MRVLIVAKTRMGGGACIGAITETGKSVRLVPFNADPHDGANKEYNVGDIWKIAAELVPEVSLTPPHNENIVVHEKQHLHSTKDTKDLVSAIELLMPPRTGHPQELYEGLLQTTGGGRFYISKQGGIPPYSTTFWRTDQPLTLDTEKQKLQYRYPTGNGGCTFTFGGFQEPIESIPAGTLLRVSLAHWWRPEEAPDREQRCYAQISGWFLQVAKSDEPASPSNGGTASIVNADTKSLEVLKSVFGHVEFRPFQKEIIDHILKGQDALIVLPTGGGKSLCYQLPALIFDGLTVVVSPLISLMQDQVTQLQNRGINAAFLNSSVIHSKYVTTMQAIRQAKIKLLYVAPETLVRPEILTMLDESDVSCIAIDEAHCISQWGYDFRPVYRDLVSVRERFPNAVCTTLTATATPRVQKDIKELLKLGEGNEFVGSFDRENLFISVEPKVELHEQTLAFLNRHRDESGIIYCQTIRQVESICRNLADREISVHPYHANLDYETRKQNQEAFINGEIQVIVATIAFGMGIDKADVRFVLHAGLPKEPESYYQEIGRSGRDGLPSDCLLLFSQGDVGTIHYFIDQGAQSEKQDRIERLKTLVDWTTSLECRRKGILAYFGEQYKKQNCGMCDNCRKAEIERINLTIPAQKFLSCVVRTGQIFGEAYIIDVLRGSQRKKIYENRHDQLTTYGIGTDYSKMEWRNLSHQLLQNQLLLRDAQHGSLRLTEQGWGVLNGGELFWGFQVGATIKKPGLDLRDALAKPQNDIVGTSEEPLEYASELFKQLQNKCEILAKTEQKRILNNRSLKEMATYFPRTRQAFMRIHGIGPKKTKQYADHFLPIICDYCREHGVESVEVITEPLNSNDATSGKQNEYDQELFDRLRDKRKKVAEAEQVSPSTVFPIMSLKDMAAKLPQTVEAFMQIHDVGEGRKKYADIFLSIIRDYCKEYTVEVDTVQVVSEELNTYDATSEKPKGYSQELSGGVQDKHDTITDEGGTGFLVNWDKILKRWRRTFSKKGSVDRD